MAITWEIEEADDLSPDMALSDLLYYVERCHADIQRGIEQGEMVTDTAVLSLDLLSMIEEIIRRREEEHAER